MPVTPFKRPGNAKKTHRQTIQSAQISKDDAVAEYLRAMRERDFSPGSLRVYANDLSLFVRWYEKQTGQGYDTRKLTSIDLQSYRGYLQNVEGKKPATINRRVQVLRSFCRWAHGHRLLKEDVGRHVKSIRTERRLAPKGLSRNEVHALLRAAKSSGRGQARRNDAILQTLLQTGIRAGELSRLRVADVKLGKRKGSLDVRNGKGRRARQVPLNASARDAIRAYLDERKLEGDSPLFISERGGALTVAGLEMLIHALRRRAGIDRDGINVHCWRHTFAFRWLKDRPGDLTGLQRLLGHERLDTTAIYCQPSQEDLAEKLERSSNNVFSR